jgi:hypothetical protein
VKQAFSPHLALINYYKILQLDERSFALVNSELSSVGGVLMSGFVRFLIPTFSNIFKIKNA